MSFCGSFMGMADATEPQNTAEEAVLVSSLSVVEAQPLDERAEGYAALYEDLRRRLESDDIAK
ncbi:MAG: hypothetical protein RLZZ600_159 [Actinomycetota bacterium]